MDEPSRVSASFGLRRPVRRRAGALCLGLAAAIASQCTIALGQQFEATSNDRGQVVQAWAMGSAAATQRFVTTDLTPAPPPPVYRIPSPAPSGAAFADPDRLLQRTAYQEAEASEPPADPAPPVDDSGSPGGAADGENGAADDQEGPTFGQAPVSNALQFLRTQDVLLAPGKWQADTGLVYTNFDQLVPVGVTSGGPDLTGVVQGHIRRRLLYTPLALRYGITKNIQFFSFMPVGWSNTQISTVGSTFSTNQGGQGDLTAGLNLHLFEACGDRPDVIASIGVTAPSGPYSAPLFGVVPGGNLGQGFWAVQGNLLFINRYDPIIAFYGFGYRHLFQRDFGGVEFQAGEQISYQFGVGFSANDRVTLSATFLGWYVTSSVQNFVGIPGSNLEPLEMRFAATIARRDRIIEPFAILGVTQFAPAAQIGITVTFY